MKGTKMYERGFYDFCIDVYLYSHVYHCSPASAAKAVKNWKGYQNKDFSKDKKSYGIRTAKDMFIFGGQLRGNIASF